MLVTGFQYSYRFHLSYQILCMQLNQHRHSRLYLREGQERRMLVTSFQYSYRFHLSYEILCMQLNYHRHSRLYLREGQDRRMLVTGFQYMGPKEEVGRPDYVFSSNLPLSTLCKTQIQFLYLFGVTNSNDIPRPETRTQGCVRNCFTSGYIKKSVLYVFQKIKLRNTRKASKFKIMFLSLNTS